MTTPSSRLILGKPKIELCKVLRHTNGKNGVHFYGDNCHNTTKSGENSDSSSRLVTKNLMHHAGRNGEYSCMPFNLNNTSCGFMLKEVDWRRNLKLNYTSGGLNISEVDWGDHDPSTKKMNKILLSEVDWRALHDSSFFPFLGIIDYDAKPKYFFTQGIWGGLPDRVSSTTIRRLNHAERILVHQLELQKGSSRMDHQLDQQMDPKSSPCPQHESSYNLLDQWDPGEKPLFPQLFRTTISAKIIYFLWIQYKYNISCLLSKHWKLLKLLAK